MIHNFTDNVHFQYSLGTESYDDLVSPVFIVKWKSFVLLFAFLKYSMTCDDCLPRFQSFLCCIDIRNGIIFTGILNFFGSIADIALSALSLHTLAKSTNSVGTTLIYSIMLMSLGLFELLLACFLLNGVCKVSTFDGFVNKDKYLIIYQYETAHLFVYLWLKVIGIILMFISMVLAFLVNKWIGTYLIVSLGKHFWVLLGNPIIVSGNFSQFKVENYPETQ